MSAAAFSLSLPAEALNLGTARTFASRVAARFGCADDTVLDLKLAVSEACTGWMSEPGTVRVSVRPEADHLRIEVSGEGSIADASDPLFAGSGPTRVELIRSLFPDVVLAPLDDGFYAVRFSVPTQG